MASGYCALTKKYCPSLDEHHIVPREYGGEQGPTILLSPEIHQVLHRCISNSRMQDEFISSLPQETKKVAQMLIRAIKEAKEREYVAEKKTFTVTVSMSTYKRLQAMAADKQTTVSSLISKMLEGSR